MRPAPSSDLFRARAAAAAAVMLVAGCGGAPSASPSATPVSDAPATAAGFLAPPSALQATWTPQGGVALAGRAPAQAAVTLRSPEGDRLDAAADAGGRWGVQAQPDAAPRLFALAAQFGARTLRGEGAVALLPPSAATPALLLRSGAPAFLIARPAPSLRLVSLDFDGGGGFAVSGSAPPGAAVGLTLDGEPAGQGKADRAGRFGVLSISAPVPPGDHLVAVRAGDGVDARIVSFTPAMPLAAPYRAAPTPQGWRIDWSPPGGGVQTLMAFARRPSSAPPAPSAPRAGTLGRSGA